jgi:hypothetical protein
MDYLVPTACDVPRIEIEHLETVLLNADVNFRGVGHAGMIGAPPTVVNVIEDALSPFSVRIYEQHLLSPAQLAVATVATRSKSSLRTVMSVWGVMNTLISPAASVSPRSLTETAYMLAKPEPAQAPSARSWPSRVLPARRRGTAPARELSPAGAPVQESVQAIRHDPLPLLPELGGRLLAGGGQVAGLAACRLHVGAGCAELHFGVGPALG